MRRFAKPAVWAALFLASAGAGAYLAAHSDPFPPGVDRPTGTGATGSAGPSGPTASPTPTDQRWEGPMLTVAHHELYVGGTCRSRWETSLRIAVDGRGAATGAGLALPAADASCDFAVAQRQAKRVRMRVRGRLTPAGVLKITFVQVRPVPAGSTDLGGFLVFLRDARLSLARQGDETHAATYRRRLDDGNRGTYGFDGSVRLACSTGCPG